MSVIRNDQLLTLVKMENLIGHNEKLLFGEDKKAVFKYQERIYHKGGDSELINCKVTIEDFNDFINVIEDLINEKKLSSARVMACRNPEYHRQYNREWGRKNREHQRKNKEYQKWYYQNVTKVKRQQAKKGL